MAPALRSSTQDKTKVSVEAAKRAGYVRWPRKPARRKPIPRNKRYPSTKGLVNLKRSKGLQHITNVNANSPLLCLPPEIRNMIFETALHRPVHMRLYFNGLSRFSGSGYSNHVHKVWRERIAFNLPQACRQIYLETATLLYRVNTFSFATAKPLQKWLSKRLPAELEAIEHLELLQENAEERAKLFQELKDTLCPNLRTLTSNEETARNTIRSRTRAERRHDNDDRDYISTDDEETWAEMHESGYCGCCSDDDCY